jgi:hypothetical protein
VIANISKSTWPILMQFAAYGRIFSWPHISTKIMAIAKYCDYVIHSLKNPLKIKIVIMQLVIEHILRSLVPDSDRPNLLIGRRNI